MNNVALKRGGAEVLLQDSDGKNAVITLKKALFIPSYPQSIVSVQAATTDGAKVIFQEGRNELMSKEGIVFRIEENERLYYLRTVNNHKHNPITDIMSKDKVSDSFCKNVA